MKTLPRRPGSLLDKFIGFVEKSPASDKILLKVFLLVVLVSGIWFVLAYNQTASVVSPVRGGTITEGVVGTPRFVNPVLAITRADKDVSALVYSNLMKINTEGQLVNDLADTITLSEDGLTYNITIRKDVRFHDNTPLTASDVVFTLQLIQDPNLKSPLRANWTDVTITQINEYELTITLLEPYTPFIENFTVGILPAHAWSSLPIEQLPFSQLNTEPIGSGPFVIENAFRDTSGVIDNYTLRAYRESIYDPKVDKIDFAFFTNEEGLLIALTEGTIDATSYLPPQLIDDAITSEYNVTEVPLPRTFAVFFNQNRSPALRDAAAREALELATNRDELIATAVNGYGVPIFAPIANSESAIESENGVAETPSTTPTSSPQAVLEAGGWEQNEGGLWEKEIDGDTIALEVNIRTSSAPLFEGLLSVLGRQWKDIGIEVSTEQFEQSGLAQSVIRPRDFQALLFGVDTNRSNDLYSFWHSSQQDDPGLNIAQYANTEVDDLLEAGRTEQEETARLNSLSEASKIIAEEHPAIFLFRPNMVYITSKNVELTPLNNLAHPSDRFSNITDWHTDSASLWQVFQ